MSKVELFRSAADRRSARGARVRAAPAARHHAGCRSRVFVEQTESRLAVLVSWRATASASTASIFRDTSSARAGELRGVDDCVDAMARRRSHSRANAATMPAYTMGHSMGAMTALFTAALEIRTFSAAIAIATGYGRPTSLEALRKVGATDFRSSYVVGVSLPDLVAGRGRRYAQLPRRLAGAPGALRRGEPRRHGKPAAACGSSTIARPSRSRSRPSTAITPMPPSISKATVLAVAQRTYHADAADRGSCGATAATC